MPNWTTNNIQIRGTKESLDKFINDGQKRFDDEGKEYYCFGSWIPRPETYDKYDTTNYPYGERLVVGNRVGWDKDSPVVTEELIEEYKQASKEQMEKYGAIGWYDWNKLNYGCKWDSDFDLKRESDTLLTFECDTPWCAPEAFLLTISQRYPDLEIELYAHYEDGFNDHIIYNDGCGQECDDVKEFAKELEAFMLQNVNDVDEINDVEITEGNIQRYIKAVHRFINSGCWRQTSLEDNWDGFLEMVDILLDD